MAKFKFLGEGGIFIGFHSAQIRKPQDFQLILPYTPKQAFLRCILFDITQYAASAANPSDMTLGQMSPKTPKLDEEYSLWETSSFSYMVSSYLRWFCMKSQTAVIPVMVNGAPEGLSHMPAAVKSIMVHTQAVMGKLVRTESPLLVGDCKGKSCKTHSGFPNLLPEAEYSTCLSDWCRDVTEGGRGCEGRKTTWYHTQQNTWIISQRSSNSSTTSIVAYSQPCLLSYACRQILTLWDKMLFFCEFKNISMRIMT